MRAQMCAETAEPASTRRGAECRNLPGGVPSGEYAGGHAGERADMRTEAAEPAPTRRGAECHNLPGGLRAVAGRDWLHLCRMSGQPLKALPEAAEIPIAPGTQEYAVLEVRIRQEAAGAESPVPSDNACAVLSPDVLALRPVLRLPRPGDRIKPLGAPGTKSLRRWMTDRGVDPAFRPLLPVVAAGSDVLWIPSLCTAEALRLRRVPDGSARLRLAGGAPYLPQLPKE